MGGPSIEGMFAHEVGNKPIVAGRKKTGSYVDGNRKLDARFCVTGAREYAGPNASAQTVQLQIIRLRLDVIAYQKWNSGISE